VAAWPSALTAASSMSSKDRREPGQEGSSRSLRCIAEDAKGSAATSVYGDGGGPFSKAALRCISGCRLPIYVCFKEGR